MELTADLERVQVIRTQSDCRCATEDSGQCSAELYGDRYSMGKPRLVKWFEKIRNSEKIRNRVCGKYLLS